MKRAVGILFTAIFVVGCGDSGKPSAESAQANASGKPAAQETKACIAGYLSQCGWSNIELVSLSDCPQVPAGATPAAEAWAFTFTVTYTNVVGERQTSENWVAVVSRADGKPTVISCFDSNKQLVGGHRGNEKAVTANLKPMAPADDLPPIVAPVP